MTRQIPLSQGMVALVDDADYEYLMQWKWYAAKNNRTGTYYARRMANKKLIYMHRVITGAGPGQEPDHINHNGLDNRRCNLQLGSHLENMQNRRYKPMSGYKGVKSHRNRKSVRYFAQIVVGRKHVYLGIFPSPEEAAYAWDEAAKIFRPDYKFLNFREASE